MVDAAFISIQVYLHAHLMFTSVRLEEVNPQKLCCLFDAFYQRGMAPFDCLDSKSFLSLVLSIHEEVIV